MEGGNFTEKLDISLYSNFTLRYKIYIRVELCISLQLSRKTRFQYIYTNIFRIYFLSELFINNLIVSKKFALFF